MANYTFMVVSSGSCTALSAPNIGAGEPRIFEGDGLYLYNILMSFVTSKNGGATWTGILPIGTFTVNSVAQTSGSSMYSNTVAFASTASGNLVKYQSSQSETASGWATSGSFARDFGAVDAIAYYDTLPVIVGNSIYLPKVKIGTVAPPYEFSDGGTGILYYDPLTDLDAAL